MAKARTWNTRYRGPSEFRSFRGIFRPVAMVMLGLSVVAAICGLVAWIWDQVNPSDRIPEGSPMPLVWTAVITIVIGAALLSYGQRNERKTISRREAVLSVAVIWLAAGVVGALPFILGAGLGPADAFFEAISGLTTTGATVISDIEQRLTRPLLLWRSVLQWLGGMGIVVLFVAIFPTLGAGGKHMFRGEVPGAQAEGLRPRIAETSYTLWRLYVLFTIIEFFILIVLGMDAFEALCHALTTMSTGGFSTRDASLGGFNSAAIEYVVATFMLIASVNYALYFAAFRGRRLGPIIRSLEFRVFVTIVGISIAAFTYLNLGTHGGDWLKSFRSAYFMTATTISSTGYGADDYTQWSRVPFALLLTLMFIGGCSGSTAGGIKVERIILMFKQSVVQIRLSFEPSLVQVIRMGRSVVPTSIVSDVMSFFVIYMACLAVGVAVVSGLDGVPVETSFGAMLTCLSNMGPAPFHSVADNFQDYSWASKLCFVFAMLLGRLEFFTILALLSREFWKR